MVEHLNAFQGLAFLLLGSLPDNWETLVVTLGNAVPQGKSLSLEMMKSSLLNEEARRKGKESIFDHKVLFTEGDSYRGSGRQRSPQNMDESRSRSKLKARPMCFYCGKPGHFQKNCQHY